MYLTLNSPKWIKSATTLVPKENIEEQKMKVISLATFYVLSLAEGRLSVEHTTERHLSDETGVVSCQKMMAATEAFLEEVKYPNAVPVSSVLID